jgi:hypothetical protein
MNRTIRGPGAVEIRFALALAADSGVYLGSPAPAAPHRRLEGAALPSAARIA